MSGSSTNLFDTKFPHLRQAPVAEAVIHWQAIPSKELVPNILKGNLVERLPEYINFQDQTNIEISAGQSNDGTVQQLMHQAQWTGLRLENPDKQYIAQFTRTGAVFSKLPPYEQWESFQTEAKRVWSVFIDLASPTVIERLGVRFINRIPMGSSEEPADYLQAMSLQPSEKSEFPIDSFFYQDRYKVPEYAYQINWVRTIQQNSKSNDERALILDIDVFTAEAIPIETKNLGQKLEQMRWLKNHIFFSNLTEKALTQFGVES